MNVSAVIVTRGDHDLQPVIDSLPKGWEIVIWDNGENRIYRSDGWAEVCQDLSVYGRYAAIEDCTHDLIYVQDDDVIVSEPQAIVGEYLDWRHRWGVCTCTPSVPFRTTTCVCGATANPVVCNMPQEFRHDGYTDSALVGFGAAFHRDLPERVWQRFDGGLGIGVDFGFGGDVFNRTCDVVFTTLTPRVLVDVPKVNREFAEDPDRMYRQPEHVIERATMLQLARQVRDA